MDLVELVTNLSRSCCWFVFEIVDKRMRENKGTMRVEVKGKIVIRKDDCD